MKNRAPFKIHVMDYLEKDQIKVTIKMESENHIYIIPATHVQEKPPIIIQAQLSWFYQIS